MVLWGEGNKGDPQECLGAPAPYLLRPHWMPDDRRWSSGSQYEHARAEISSTNTVTRSGSAKSAGGLIAASGFFHEAERMQICSIDQPGKPSNPDR
jgi:hypothetical protein